MYCCIIDGQRVPNEAGLIVPPVVLLISGAPFARLVQHIHISQPAHDLPAPPRTRNCPLATLPPLPTDPGPAVSPPAVPIWLQDRTGRQLLSLHGVSAARQDNRVLVVFKLLAGPPHPRPQQEKLPLQRTRSLARDPVGLRGHTASGRFRTGLVGQSLPPADHARRQAEVRVEPPLNQQHASQVLQEAQLQRGKGGGGGGVGQL